MRHFIQLKDGVAFAFHSTPSDQAIIGDNVVEVKADGEQYLNKKYLNGEFINAPVIKYAILDESNDNTVIGIEATIFSSEVYGPIIDNNDVKILWKWNGESFVSPDVVAPVEVIVAPTVEFIPEEPVEE